MIRSFRSKDTERLFHRERVRSVPTTIQRVALRKLTTIARQRHDMGSKRLAPVHPGEILHEEFLVALGISQNAFARAIGVPPRRINEIVHGRRRVTADTALRLARYFAMSPEFWLGLQMDYELDMESDRLGATLEESIEPLRNVG